MQRLPTSRVVHQDQKNQIRHHVHANVQRDPPSRIHLPVSNEEPDPANGHQAPYIPYDLKFWTPQAILTEVVMKDTRNQGGRMRQNGPAVAASKVRYIRNGVTMS